MRPSGHARPLQLLVAAFLLFASALPALPVDDEEPDPELSWKRWEELLTALTVLREGTREEKLALFGDDVDFEGPFYYLDEPPRKDTRLTRDAVRELQAWFREEPDLFVLDRAAAWFAWWEFEETRSIFLDLSVDPVPSLRYRAAQYSEEMYEDVDEEILERMLASETVPWLRAVILEMLLDMDDLPASLCARILWEQDVDLVLAAIACLEESWEPEAGPLLLTRAADGPPAVRHEAVDALTAWMRWREIPDELQDGVEDLWEREKDDRFRPLLLAALDEAGSAMAVEVAQDLLWDDDPELARSAIGIVGEHRPAGAIELLVDRSVRGDPSLRAAAILALDAPELTPDVEAMLVSASVPAEPPEVRRAAVEVLAGYGAWTWMDDGHFLGPQESRQHLTGVLEGLAAGDPDPDIRAAARRGLGMIDSNSIVLGTLRGWVPDPPPFRVAPHPDGESRRCWRRPYEERSPEAALRVPAGMPVERLDRFDDGSGPWAQVRYAGETCWLPPGSLLRGDPLETPPMAVDLVRPEVDVPIRRTRDERIRDLLDHGGLEAFDRGESLVGVRVAPYLLQGLELPVPVTAADQATLLDRILGRLPPP